MLKLPFHSITNFTCLEDFFLISYIFIDDLYRIYVPEHIRYRKNYQKALLSDSEVITLSLCGELLGIDSEKAWHSFVQKNYSHLFPKLCSRSRFHRLRKALLDVTELIREKMIQPFLEKEWIGIVDSFPLPVCHFGRAAFCRSFRQEGATYGRCASKKETYFGYKVHAMTTLQGFVTHFEITPACVDDREALRDLTAQMRHGILLADKGYISDSLFCDLQKQGIQLLALKRSNSKSPFSKEWKQWIASHRRRIETTFSQLKEQFHAERVLAKSFRGLCTRLVSKIFAHNLCYVLQASFGKPNEIGKIKHLIF